MSVLIKFDWIENPNNGKLLLILHGTPFEIIATIEKEFKGSDGRCWKASTCTMTHNYKSKVLAKKWVEKRLGAKPSEGEGK